MARDNGRRENPDIPAKEQEAEAIAEAQWTGIRRGWCYLLLLILLYLLPPLVPPPTPLAQALRRALVQLHRRPW
jgi:hypothetical protein